jgi:hypothetical protein
MSSTTRAQEQSAGERNELWDMIVDNDDICFKHILPRLNQTDIKFLYDVNSETRALIKRSSRTGDLKERSFTTLFYFGFFCSISMLEFWWDTMPWGTACEYDRATVKDQAWFCSEVANAGTNELELLRWAREEKKCDWDERTISTAASRGNLEMVKYCVANQCPISEEACTNAAYHGHLECLKYLHEEANAPWDGGAIGVAYSNCERDCLQYLLDNDCPLTDGWRYENGNYYYERDFDPY